MLRNFTVLLDPPDVLAQPSFPQRPQEVAYYGSDEVGPTSGVRRHAGSPDATSLLAAAVFPADSHASEYGPVGKNEKLWTIAEKLNRDPSITQEQMVIALLRSNPHAFSRPNVNALNAGAILRIPTREDILQISPSLAREEFYRQQAGRTARRLRTTAPLDGLTAQSLETSAGVGPSRASEPRDGATQNGRSPSTVQAEAELRALQQENAELRTRLVDLENRVAELRVLITENRVTVPGAASPGTLDTKTATELDQAKGALATPAPAESTPETAEAVDPAIPTAAAAATAPPPTSDEAVGKVPLTTPSPATMARGTAAQKAGSVQTPASGAPSRTAEPLSQPSVARSGEEEEEEDHPLLWSLGGAAAAALASLLGLYYVQRRRMGSFAAEANGEETLQGAPRRAAGEVGIAVGSDPRRAATARPKGDADEVDPLFEADIYLSYGKHGQAMETVENAIRQHPEREAYRLKLLEILLVRGDTQRFQTEVASMKTSDQFAAAAFWDQAYTLAARLHAESLLDKAIEAVTATAAPAEPEPVVDETDRLIDDLKRFSLEIRGEASQVADNLETRDGEGRHARREDAEEPFHDLHHIPWSPAEPGSDSGVAFAEQIEKGFNPTPDADHLIEFAPVSVADGAQSRIPEDIASESIDSLLKELSAMHYEQHFTADEVADAANRSRYRAEGKHPEPNVSDGAASAGQNTAGSTGSDRSLDQDGNPAADLETKLDLARAYADMGDYDQAKEFLEEVMNLGSEPQKAEAAGILVALARA